MRSLVCDCVVCKPPKTGFLASRPLFDCSLKSPCKLEGWYFEQTEHFFLCLQSLEYYLADNYSKDPFHEQRPFSHLPNDRMLNIWKTTALWRKSKIGECYAAAFCLGYKYKLRKYSHKVMFTFCAINTFLSFWYIYFTWKVNLTKRENFLTWNLCHKGSNP